MDGRVWPSLAVALVAAACGSEDPAAPEEPGGPGEPGGPDPAAGLVAFQESCASCHANEDAFDLAFFDFPSADVVRRAVAHVDSATARDIAAYVETLEVERKDRHFRAFQPGERPASGDEAFWRDLFGTGGWPGETLTVDGLRNLDLRDVAVPVAFPLWSAELNESDWMPERSLGEDILDAEGGALRQALDAYRAEPTRARLLALIAEFRRITGDDSPVEVPVCRGSAAAHAHPVDCFEARRWVSALAALHFLREGEYREIPYEVAELWWETGEAGVTLHFEEDLVSRSAAAAWLYMSSIFAPDGFPNAVTGIAEDSGYMGQFLQSTGRSRLAVLVTLRRLVSTGPVHQAQPFQVYWDLNLALIRAPRSMVADVLEFGLPYLLEIQAEGSLPQQPFLEHARRIVDRYLEHLERAGGAGDPDRETRIRALVEEVAAGLEG